MKKNKLKLNKSLLIGQALALGLVFLICAAGASAKGRKFGLFVGINDYPVAEQKLRGCVNDAKRMQSTLTTKFGFKAADTTLLTDSAATRSGIIGKIKMYEQMAGEGDVFVFHYSGHGTLFPDSYSEEQDETKLIYIEGINPDTGRPEVWYPRDKYDSAIVPIDADSTTSGKPWQNLILDDELYAMFSAFTKKGVHVVFVSDSCHSGSIAKAKKTSAKRKTVPLAKVFRVKSFDDLKLRQPATRKSVAPPQMNGLYLALTGARDEEFSLDIPGAAGGVPMGLFTSTLLSALNSKEAATMTYAQLINTVSPSVAKSARERYESDQNPQLDSRFGNPNAKLFNVLSAF